MQLKVAEWVYLSVEERFISSPQLCTLYLTSVCLSVCLAVCLFLVGKKKEKRSKVSEEGRGKRNAIHLNEVYTVETVVVADSNMVQYHGAEAAQRFLLTVMNMVRHHNYTCQHMMAL